MIHNSIESSYPLTFREHDANVLGEALIARRSLVLIGMKRVGISHFLRFFLNHQKIISTYLKNQSNHLFIPVDLNDLVEREISPFWILTLKRIADSVESSTLDDTIKRKIDLLFLNAIQSKSLFLVVDSIRKSLSLITHSGRLPTIFFIRFDRIQASLTPEVFANLQGMQDATHNRLSYVFTSSRSLDHLAADVLPRTYLSAFSHSHYFKPANRADSEIIFKQYSNFSQLYLTDLQRQELFRLVDGYTQYLQLSLIKLSEQPRLPKSFNFVFEMLSTDERILLQSEELWESLNQDEQSVLLKISRNDPISSQERHTARYLWDTGLVSEKDRIFSPLLEYYLNQLKERTTGNIQLGEFSKKEYMLFAYLKDHINEICEREEIIENVWSEVEQFGVSDWAIDRLVARVRSKLKKQNSPYQIMTIKTRGYKLI